MATIKTSVDFGGGLSGPPFLFLDPSMTRPTTGDEPNHSGLESKIAGMITPQLVNLGYDLVRVAVLGRERPTIQVMADRADGSQISVGDCERITHAVSAVLDVEDPLPGAWTLEVSSAGIDRPLTRLKDWVRFAGHQARVEMLMPYEGRRRFTGIILGADEMHATLRLDDGTDAFLPMNDMRRAKLLLTDALIAATAPAQSEADAHLSRPEADANLSRPEADIDLSRPETAGPKLAN